MKKILYISGLLLLVISGISCSDDFLSKNNVEGYTLSDTLYVNNNQANVNTSLQLPITGNSDYTIIMQPKFLSFNSMHGKITNGNIPLSFSIVKEYLPAINQTQCCTVVLDIENFGLASFFVICTNFGSPNLQCSASSLTFESTSPQTFTIENTSEGILNWQLTGIPDWLVLSSTSGSLYNGNSTTITASLNNDNTTIGQEISGSIQINSNSVSGGFTITVKVSAKATIPPDIRQINGIVTDAGYNHESGIMAICTKSPNSLILFNTNTNISNTISLSRTPNCVSLSEDGHKAVIGYSVSELSYIDIDNMEITADYTIDCIPYDIVLMDNGWCYITPAATSWDSFRSFSPNTGSLLSVSYPSMIYGKVIIKKIHGKPYLVATRPDLSPTGLIICDVTKGKASDSLSYYHEDIGNFWISEDGTRLYTRTKKVYSLPEYNGEYNLTKPPVYGQIESDLFNISGLNECPAINSIFVFSSFYGYPTESGTRIEQYNTDNFNKINTFHVSPVSVTENGVNHLYETNPRFIFVNKEGSTLYSINNLKETIQKDYWTIETFHLGTAKAAQNRPF